MMTKLLLSLTLTGAFISAAHAETIKLTGTQLTNLATGLAALDGYQHIIKDGAQQRVIPEAYTFTPGTREAIAADSVAVDVTMDGRRTEFKAFLKVLGEAWRTVGSPEAKQASDHLEAESEHQFEVDLTKLDVAELNLAANAIPPSVLKQLAPILNDLGGGKPKAKP